jgi:uncharacterized protein
VSSTTTERLRVALDPPQAVSTTSVLLWRPQEDRGGVTFVLAHGAGSDFTHPTLRAISRGLAERGHRVAVFNFGYSEAGRRRPDPMPRLEAAYRDVLAGLRPHLGNRPVVIGGRSMGGRVATHIAARGEPCAGLCLLGYPLHPAGRPERLRTDHWPALRLPMLFVTGDRDRLCDLTLLERQRAARLGGADSVVHVVAGADHGFGVRVRDGRGHTEVLGEVVDVVASWAARLAPGRVSA